MLLSDHLLILTHKIHVSNYKDCHNCQIYLIEREITFLSIFSSSSFANHHDKVSLKSILKDDFIQNFGVVKIAND